MGNVERKKNTAHKQDVQKYACVQTDDFADPCLSTESV